METRQPVCLILLRAGKCVYGSFSQMMFYVTVHFLRMTKLIKLPFPSH